MSSKKLSAVDLARYQKIEKAVLKESETRESRFIKGLNRYRDSSFIGPQTTPATSIIKGKHCNLLFYRSANRKTAERKPLILCIPSLVNKYYILDLTPQSSIVQQFNHDSFDVCMVEWHKPKPEDKDLGLDGYLLSLMETIQIHWDNINRPIVTLGYCLGGIIASALACLFPRISGLILLATPWDFSHYSFAKMDKNQRKILEGRIHKTPIFPSENVQSLCYLANSGNVINQFSEFSESNSIRKEMNFVAIQHWANDGVDITQKVAKQCLIDWPQNNSLMKNEWVIGGHKIKPGELTIPTFAAIPTNDNIVPYKCATGLADQLQNVTLITPASGHVGMIAGIEQRDRLTIPLRRWLEQF